MLPFTEPLSAVEEFRHLKRIMKKILTCILIGCLIIIKLSYIATVMRIFTILNSVATYSIYLCLAGIACLLPMYYSAAAVKGYNVFLVCACGSLIVEACEFFLFFGMFNDSKWMILGMANFCGLLLVLTLIESLFEEKQLRQGEDIPLSETTNNFYTEVASEVEAPPTPVDDGLTEEERFQQALTQWRKFRRQMWRPRSL
uniref:MARVEL domain-containing protein n=1 Tax=Caenorhabditis tropicalis TaxID=1561998 RepID=A0A1I7TNP9_9PELO